MDLGLTIVRACRVLLLLLCVSVSYNSFSQNSIEVKLNQNKVNATVNDVGFLFSDRLNNRPGYEIPKGDSNHIIYSSSFMFGGMDQDSTVYLSARHFQDLADYTNGPYSLTGDYLSPDYLYAYQNSMWKVSKEEIIYHIDNYNQSGYEAPDGIANWPGNGKTDVGVSADLAPFIDVDGDGVYDPSKGDYPCIKGDEATYMILNDDAIHNYETGGDPLGIEFHLMLYQFNTGLNIDHTTFINLKVINRGEIEFIDFRVLYFVDADIGFYADDYSGCDTNANLMYTYNATNFDIGNYGVSGYGENPPAMGVSVLNKNMDYFFSGNNLNFNPMPLPISFWNYMNGRWADNSLWYYGGNGYTGSTGVTNIPTNYLYTGNPLTGEGWSELNTDGEGSANPEDQDIRMYMTTKQGAFNPGDEVVNDYAVLYDRSGNHLENAVNLSNVAYDIKDFYDNSIVNNNCMQQGTGVVDNFDEEEYIVLNQMFEITRLEGKGNMKLAVDLKEETVQEILDSVTVKEVHYKRGQGPIKAYIADTLDHVTGYFLLKFDTSENIDTANWTIYRYDKKGGDLIDSVNSLTTIVIGEEHYIEDWGIAVQVKQEKYECGSGMANCPLREKLAEPLLANMTFKDESKSWLSGVSHNNGFTPLNWITSGTFSGYEDYGEVDINSPSCYPALSYTDPDYKFSNLIDGIISPGQLARFIGCGFNPIGVPLGGIMSVTAYNSIARNFQSTIYQPNINLVFTVDTSKWTRCVVLELNNEDSTSIGNAKPGMLRKSPSVDKNGNPDNTNTVGKSWFPGYAIDVETGRRLNMAFCENSTLEDDNGTDMIWNPTSRLFDEEGNPILGGQHTIYVFGGEWDDFPAYDKGNYIHTNLSAETSEGFRNVYKNLSWVMQPLLKEEESLLATDVEVKIRLNREFEEYEINGENEGRPMFEWNAIPYDSVNFTMNTPSDEDVLIFPNPSSDKIIVKWSKSDASDLVIYNMSGAIVYRRAIEEGKYYEEIDITSFAGGVYIVRVDSEYAKLVVN